MIQMIPLRQILDFYIRPFVELSYIYVNLLGMEMMFTSPV